MVASDEAPEVDAARRLAPRIRAAADETERARRLSPDLVQALADAGLFALCVPRRYGGGERDPRALLEAIEEIARGDGAAGWCVMIAATTGLVGGYLAETGAREVFADPRRPCGGVLAPHGRAIAAPGGFRVSGRWPFGSGCEHSGWLVGGAVRIDDGKPRRRPDESPDLIAVVFPTGAATIHDTWDVAGLRGTGSHDFEISDVFVPAERSFELPSPAPQVAGRLYALPLYGLLASGIAAVALGLARAAREEIVDLAAVKTPTGSRRLLRERGLAQVDVARAEALHGSARAYLHETITRAVDEPGAAAVLPVPERARIRLAATHAARSAVEAVDLMYEAGGGTAIYGKSRLQRIFRDAHALTQHVMVSRQTLEVVGRIRLGIDTDVGTL